MSVIFVTINDDTRNKPRVTGSVFAGLDGAHTSAHQLDLVRCNTPRRAPPAPSRRSPRQRDALSHWEQMPIEPSPRVARRWAATFRRLIESRPFPLSPAHPWDQELIAGGAGRNGLYHGGAADARRRYGECFNCRPSNDQEQKVPPFERKRSAGG